LGLPVSIEIPHGGQPDLGTDPNVGDPGRNGIGPYRGALAHARFGEVRRTLPKVMAWTVCL
jgi:hypothetical protein